MGPECRENPTLEWRGVQFGKKSLLLLCHLVNAQIKWLRNPHQMLRFITAQNSNRPRQNLGSGGCFHRHATNLFVLACGSLRGPRYNHLRENLEAILPTDGNIVRPPLLRHSDLPPPPTRSRANPPGKSPTKFQEVVSCGGFWAAC